MPASGLRSKAGIAEALGALDGMMRRAAIAARVAARDDTARRRRQRDTQPYNFAQPAKTAMLVGLDEMSYAERHVAESVGLVAPHLLAWCQARLDLLAGLTTHHTG